MGRKRANKQESISIFNQSPFLISNIHNQSGVQTLVEPSNQDIHQILSRAGHECKFLRPLYSIISPKRCVQILVEYSI